METRVTLKEALPVWSWIQRGGSGGLDQTTCPSHPLSSWGNWVQDLYLVSEEACVGVWVCSFCLHFFCRYSFAECAVIVFFFSLAIFSVNAWTGHCRCLLTVWFCMCTYRMHAFTACKGPQASPPELKSAWKYLKHRQWWSKIHHRKKSKQLRSSSWRVSEKRSPL